MTACGVLNILGWDSKHNGGLVPFRILKMNLVVTPAFVGGAKAKHSLQAMEGKAIMITSAALLPRQDASGDLKREVVAESMADIRRNRSHTSGHKR